MNCQKNDNKSNDKDSDYYTNNKNNDTINIYSIFFNMFIMFQNFIYYNYVQQVWFNCFTLYLNFYSKTLNIKWPIFVHVLFCLKLFLFCMFIVFVMFQNFIHYYYVCVIWLFIFCFVLFGFFYISYQLW